MIAGPCVIESEEIVSEVACFLKELCARLRVPFIFKSSYDKANRTSVSSFRGPGMEKGLEVLAAIRESTAIPVLTDVHTPAEVEPVSRVADVLQIPAFLARQTDILTAAGKTGKPVNVKKAQFLSPKDMAHVIDKIKQTGNDRILLTERGAQFGYNNLVVDMRSIAIMSDFGYPVVFDATHSVQLPGGMGNSSGGERRFVRSPCPRGGCSRRPWRFHRNPPRPGQGPLRRPQFTSLEHTARLLADLVRIFEIVRNPSEP